jgi:hypothetical protein
MAEIHGGDVPLAIRHFDDWGKSKGLERRQATYMRASRDAVTELHILPFGE